jgi:hypothetical protein
MRAPISPRSAGYRDSRRQATYRAPRVSSTTRVEADAFTLSEWNQSRVLPWSDAELHEKTHTRPATRQPQSKPRIEGPSAEPDPPPTIPGPSRTILVERPPFWHARTSTAIHRQELPAW